MIKLSIVTVSFNAAATLADTLQSVARQSHPLVEHWLIDGASKDNTRAIVAAHGSHLAGFVSEPDQGLFDAMNKGANRCTGSAIGFLNADDWYAHPDALSWVAAAFAEGADLVYGDLNFVEPSPPHPVRRVWRDSHHDAMDLIRRGWHPAHPTTFVRADLFHQLGGFDLRWRIGADFGFLAKALLNPGLRIQHLPRTLINMRLGGASTSGIGAVWEANRQCAQALRELNVPRPWAVVVRKVARKIPQLWHALRFRSVPDPHAPLWKPWN
jgi:glycosyltransferase involved in cell wall biosynthesis